MPVKIKLTSDELGLISLFQSVSGATAKDCVVDSKEERIIFLVGKGEMGLAIGKGGASIKNVERLVGKPIELVEDCDDPKDFIRNLLNYMRHFAYIAISVSYLVTREKKLS